MSVTEGIPDIARWRGLNFLQYSARKAGQCNHCLGHWAAGDVAYAPVGASGKDVDLRLDLRCARVFEVKG